MILPTGRALANRWHLPGWWIWDWPSPLESHVASHGIWQHGSLVLLEKYMENTSKKTKHNVKYNEREHTKKERSSKLYIYYKTMAIQMVGYGSQM